MKMWYDKEASIWEEALPLGNGRIGAMVWSGVGRERVSLNEDTLWSGYPQDHNIPGAAQHFATARQLAMEGKYCQAQNHIEDHMLGHYSQGYLPMGELLLKMMTAYDTTGYCRQLDIENSLSILEYQQGDRKYKRESFVSAPDQVMVMRLSSDAPKSISVNANFTCQLRSNVRAKGRRLILEGIAPSEARPLYHLSDCPIVYETDPKKQGMSFIVIADFEISGGKSWTENDTIHIYEADEVIIRLCCHTSFDENPHIQNCEKDINNALSLDYETLKARHIADYHSLYNRVEISFGPGNDDQTLPNRLSNWEQSEKDTALYALLFQYGRYLMIAGSRPGTTPLNLQGIWNPHLHPPWSSNYTVNINTEMNYWPAEVANLSECHRPLFDFINRLRVTGAETARVHYNAGGFVVHHNSDLWGLSSPVGERGRGRAVHAFWPLAAGWLAAHAFDHYLFTLDKNFLRETAWPIIKDAARFYLDVLVEDSDGTLIFAPSTSPENRFIYNDVSNDRELTSNNSDSSSLANTVGYAVSKTTTMTTAIIRETLSNVIRCCDVLGNSPEIKKEALAVIRRLPNYQIGSRGELLEWSEELPEYEPAHRHTSHLYPLHPGMEIKAGTPLADACARTLELRGGEGTGWALAWRVNLWARLQQAEKAFLCLKKQLRPATDTLGGCYPNLFGAHPPFQIDSNFGACAGIAELLLQSSSMVKIDGDINDKDINNVIMLLPALPKALGTGYVKGLRARGGLTVSIFFADGFLEKAELALDEHLPKQSFMVVYKNDSRKIELEPGQIYTIGVF